MQHKQVYLFKYHKAKLKILPSLNKIIPNHIIERLTNYLKKIPTDEFPHHIFNEEIRKNYTEDDAKENAEYSTNYSTTNYKKNTAVVQKEQEQKQEQRGSKLKFQILPFIRLEKNNYANKLAKLALKTALKNYQRHQTIQDFMLINDTSTIAIEVPVYLTNDDIKYFLNKNFKLDLKDKKTPITGHIDILQIRNNLIHILDYKPEAKKINPINQLTLYSLALASRLQIPVKQLKAAWFDENNYFEFFPLHAVYINKDNKNQNLEFNRINEVRI